jgi:predicted glutamine amidotransferase
MCVAVFIPELSTLEHNITKDIMRLCWTNNSDGAGYMFVAGSKLVIKKGFYKFKPLYKSFFRDQQDNKTSKFVLHFRIASRGSMSVNNCHPHTIIQDTLAMVHNGTILNDAKMNEGDSDSVIFAKQFLAKLPSNFYMNETYSYLLDKYLNRNKVIVLDSQNNHHVYNEYLGVWDNGVWYSNESYKEEPKPTAITSYATYQHASEPEKYCMCCNKTIHKHGTYYYQNGICYECGKFMKHEDIINLKNTWGG